MKIEAVNTEFKIDVGAPTPTILSNEYDVYLIFYVNVLDPDWDGSYVNVRSQDDQGIATVKLSHFAQFKFGNPNDEAINGHPYYRLGLQPYAIQEVFGSDWIEELRSRNSVHPYHQDKQFENYRRKNRIDRRAIAQ